MTPLAWTIALMVAAQARPPALAEQRVRLETAHGDLVLALFPDVAPRHTAQLLKLARLGVFDGTHIFRIEDRFVAQVSLATDRLTPLTEVQRAAIVTLPAELSDQPHVRGTLSMARQDDDLDSATTSFSIILGPARHLDGKYTVFGRLEEGWDTLARIEQVPRDGSRPLKRLTILRATVLEPPSSAVGERALAIGLALAGLALAASVVAWRAGASRARSAAMVVLLCAFFLALAGALWARAELRGWGGLLMFVGAVALFRYLATFESPARR